MTDAQWAVLEPLLPIGRKPGRPPKWTKRQLINGLRWRSGISTPRSHLPGAWSGSPRPLPSRITGATGLAWLGQAHAAAGDTDGARRLFSQAERVATEAAGAKPQVWGLTELLKARAAAGDHESVRRVARRAERAALTEKSSDLWHGQPLSSLSMALTATGDVDEGERVAAMVPDNYHASQAWRALEQSLAASGKTGRARRAARWAAELEGRPNTP